MKWSRLAIGIVAVISVITLHAGRWNNAPLHTDLTVIRGDGQGFYAWLPAVFIYHDLSFSYYEDTTQHIEGYFSPRFLNKHNGKTILKTPCGEAMMVAPFFLANLAIRSITGKSSTGYEASYQRVLGWAALFYFLAGLWCMVYMLKRLGIDDIWRAMVIIVTALGTNLWYYAIYHPSMTHVYSFFLVAFACVLWIRWSDNRNRSSMLLLGIVLGLIYLVRPVNLMVVMAFPLFVNSTRKWWAGLPETFLLINRNLGQLAMGVVMFVGVVGIQLVLNYMQCGYAFAWAYKNEGFDFLHPRLGSVWWNFNKGLFIYTPLVLVALAGLACKPGFRSLWWISFFVLVSYVTSSWWNWNYGSGFGMRPFVDFYALLLLPLAFWQWAGKKWKVLVAGLSVTGIALCQLQTWQFNHLIIHPEEMNMEKYHYVFLKTNDSYVNSLGGGNGMPSLPVNAYPFFTAFTDFETSHPDWQSTYAIEGTDSEGKGRYNGVFNDTVLYNALIRIPAYEWMKHEEWMLYLSLDRLEQDSCAAHEAVVVFTYLDEDGNNSWYNKLRINDYPRPRPGQWHSFQYMMRMPPLKEGLDKECLVYIYNPARKSWVVDNVHLAAHRYIGWEE